MDEADLEITWERFLEVWRQLTPTERELLIAVVQLILEREKGAKA